MKESVTINGLTFSGYFTPAENYQRSSITQPEPAKFEIKDISNQNGLDVTKEVYAGLDIVGIDPKILEDKCIEKLTS